MSAGLSVHPYQGIRRQAFQGASALFFILRKQCRPDAPCIAVVMRLKREREHSYAALLDRCFTAFSMTGKEGRKAERCSRTVWGKETAAPRKGRGYIEKLLK